MRSLTPVPRAADAALASDLDAALLGHADAPPRAGSTRLRERVLADVAAASDAAPAPLARRRHAGAGRRLAAAAAVGGVLLVGGIAVPGAVAGAEARQVLTTTAERAVHAEALRPGAGQYVKEVSVTHYSERAPLEGEEASKIAVAGSTTYTPAGAGGLVVGVPDPVRLFDGTVQPAPPSGARPAERTGPAMAAELAGVARLEELPRDPDALVSDFRSRHTGGSASPDENLYVQIVDVLREPTIPADLRSGLIGALARVPGVRADQGVRLADGRTGVGLRRAEPLRRGSVTETVLDPATGQVIGERILNGTAFGELRADTVVRETNVSATVVDSAPHPDVIETP